MRLTCDAQQGEVAAAGGLGAQREEEAMAAWRFIPVHDADGLDQLQEEAEMAIGGGSTGHLAGPLPPPALRGQAGPVQPQVQPPPGVGPDSPHLAWLGILTDGGFVGQGQFGRIVVDVQDADSEHCPGHLSRIV